MLMGLGYTLSLGVVCGGDDAARQSGAGDVKLSLPGDGDDGRWHFYAFTWDGPKARGYFDGRLDPAAEKLDFPPPQAVQFFVGRPPHDASDR